VSSVGRDEVRRMAKLARLRLSPAEAEAFGRDLNDILAYVDRLASVSVDEAIGDPTGVDLPEHGAGDGQPDPLVEPPHHFAPDFRDGFFVVPSPPSLGTEDEPPSRS